MGTDRFSEKMVEYTFSLLKRFRHQPTSILDLCCGTGTAALMFAEGGYEVTGLDGSGEMLKMARQKASYKNLPVKFIRQNLPKFDIKTGGKIKKFDLITCYYDSLNYLLKESELKQCFKSVHAHLNPNGLFIFDMNTFHAFKQNWAKTYAGCYEDIAWIFESKIDKKKKTAELTANFFLKKNNLWENFTEVHSEKAYSNTVIKKLLTQSGLQSVGLYKCFKFKKADVKTNRIVIVARKK